MKIKREESGQVLVIIVVALVGLLGAAALAVDGGMLFADRRYDQNAADDSALAGVGAVANYMEQHRITYENFSCGGGGVQSAMGSGLTAAIQRAASNNFVLDGDLSDQHGVSVTCGVEDLGAFDDYYIDVHVMITTTVESSFAHMIFSGDLTNTVEAVARVRPRTSYAFGFAIASLSPNCQGNDGGVEFDGDASVTTIGSGVFSNSCLEKDGGVTVTADTGIFFYNGYANNGSSGSVSPAPQQAPNRIPIWDITPPDCMAVPEQGKVNNGGEIQPGRYPSIAVTNKDLVMAPGLYCVSGDFKATGGTISVSGDNKDGVTIYIINGDFSTGGNVTVNLRAPKEGSAGLPPALKGVLIYLAKGNDGVVTVQGNTGSTYRGTVFAPSGAVEVGGGSSVLGNLSSQFIGNTVKFHGTSGMDVEFNEDEVWSRPAYLALQR